MSTAIIKANETQSIQAVDPLAEPHARPLPQRILMLFSKTGRKTLAREFELWEDHTAARTFVSVENNLNRLGIDHLTWVGDANPVKFSETRLKRRDKIAAPYLAHRLEGASVRTANEFLIEISGVRKSKQGLLFVSCAEVCLKAGAHPDIHDIPRYAARAGGSSDFLDVLMQYGANKEQVLLGAVEGAHHDLVSHLLDSGVPATEKALMQAVSDGEQTIVKALLDAGAPITAQMCAVAEERKYTHIPTMLHEAKESRHIMTFTAARAPEAEGNADVLIKSKEGTPYIEINDCKMYGSKADLSSFISDQRNIFSLSDAFSTWSKPRPVEETEKIAGVMNEAYARLGGRLAVYHNGEEVAGYLPFVCAHFDRASQKTDYRYLLPGNLDGVPREEVRWFKEGMQEISESPDTALARKFIKAGIVDEAPVRMRIGEGTAAAAPKEPEEDFIATPSSSVRAYLTP